MNHMALIKRAFEITRRYRVLWLFGILVALTSGGGGNGGGGGGGGGGRDGANNLPSIPGLTNFDPGAYVGVIVLCCCLLLIVAIAAVIIQYVARAALYRMVDRIETTGAAPTWREGFRLGWSNRAFRLWLLELIVTIAFLAAALVILAVAASPLLLLLTGSEPLKAVGIALAVALLLLAILALIVSIVILTLLGQFWAREIVLADRGIGEALASGYTLVRGHLRDTGVMWLLMAGIGIGFAIVTIPLVVVLVLVGVALGGGLGYAVYAATNSVAWAVAAGLPVGLLIVVPIFVFVGGLYEVFTSSAWTLTYREITLGRPARS